MVGVVGDDFPTEHIDFLRSRKIDTRGIQIIPGGKTFHWAGSYEGDMNQANTPRDRTKRVRELLARAARRTTRHPSSCFWRISTPTLQLHVLDQVAKPKLTACDTMNLWISIKKDALLEVLKRVEVVFINDAEARQLTGEINLTRAAGEYSHIGAEVRGPQEGRARRDDVLHRQHVLCRRAVSAGLGRRPDRRGRQFRGRVYGLSREHGRGRATPISARQWSMAARWLRITCRTSA